MGVAMGTAVLASKDLKHPKFELLLTLDEETGLTGAIQLGDDLLESEMLINLDTEDDHTFSIGCAGGINTIGTYKYESDSVPENHSWQEIGIKGLMGGHSGVEIHEERGAATKFITRLLFELTNKFNVRIGSINSGSKHNAIPREAFASVAIPNENLDAVLAYVKEHDELIKKEYKAIEKNVEAFVTDVNAETRVLTVEAQNRILRSFYSMPHGIVRWSPDIEGLVQTSTNFAVIETRENDIQILTSQRSSVESEKYNLANAIQSVIELGGGSVEFGDGYPSWEPNMDSSIMLIAKDLHTKRFGFEPTIEAIHAGLECGLIGAKYPDMDMLSFGPTIKEPHTPDEKVQISTVKNCWELLVDIIENIPARG
jgi:dipeptidase D